MKTVKILIRFVGLMSLDLLHTFSSNSSGKPAILVTNPLYRFRHNAVIPHPQVDFNVKVFGSFR
jgi:hypothetical protein